MKKEESAFLALLIESLEDAVDKLEYYYSYNDEKRFNMTKKFILKIEAKIKEFSSNYGS